MTITKVDQAGKPSLQDAPHEVAGTDHVVIRQVVVHLATQPDGLHDARRPHHRQVLRDVGLADADLGGQAAHVAGSVGQDMDDLEPPRVRERLAGLGLEFVERVHA